MTSTAGTLPPGCAQLLDAAPDALLLARTDGTIVFANAQAAALFRLPREAFERMRVEELMPERFRHGHERHRAGYEAAPRARPMGAGLPLLGRRGDGEEFPVEISLSHVTLEGTPYTFAAIRDVTDRKRAEGEARQHLVARQLVRQMLRQISRRGGSEPMRRELGRSLAANLETKEVAAGLDAYQAMGAGALRLARDTSPRYEVLGEGLLEVTPGHISPTCHIALGFLEGLVAAATGAAALGAEVRCQSMGHEACRFVVTAR